MIQVNVTEFRQNLPSYLAKVALGEQIRITVRGRVVARLQADQDGAKEARERLLAYRTESVVGEVCEPLLEDWQGDFDNL